MMVKPSFQPCLPAQQQSQPHTFPLVPMLVKHLQHRLIPLAAKTRVLSCVPRALCTGSSSTKTEEKLIEEPLDYEKNPKLYTDHLGRQQNHIWSKEEIQEKLSGKYRHEPKTVTDKIMNYTVSPPPSLPSSAVPRAPCALCAHPAHLAHPAHSPL